MIDKVFLKEFLESCSPSGYEFEATKLFNGYCEKLKAKHEFTDQMGNSCYSIGTGKTKIMISAHIDELGYQVQNITDKGMIQFVELGGIDKKTLPGTKVVFINKDKKIYGVIGKKPIHVETPEERSSVDKLENLLVDVGAESKKELEGIIEIGDVFLPDTGELCDLGKNRFTYRGLDDKIGVFIITQVLQNIYLNKDICKNFTVYFVANTQEEVGLRGSTVTSKRINPDISIDLDVTFATDEGRGISEAIYGNVELGKGPVIQFGPDKNMKIINKLIHTATINAIPYQRACSYAGGTNTAAIQENSLDCATALISIPNRNMHTPVEVCDYRDIEASIELITNFLLVDA